MKVEIDVTKAIGVPEPLQLIFIQIFIHNIKIISKSHLKSVYISLDEYDVLKKSTCTGFTLEIFRDTGGKSLDITERWSGSFNRNEESFYVECHTVE